MRRLAVFAVLAMGAPVDRTVVMRDGKVHEGTVTREGAEVVVISATRKVRLPAISVVAVFTTIPEARRQAEARFEQAKKLFEEASAKPEQDALRRRQLAVSLDICGETRDFLEVLEKRAPNSERESLQGVKSRLFQFMRLVRDAKGATGFADGAAEERVEKVPIEGLGLTVEGPGEAAPTTEITENLGAGQASAVSDLTADSPAGRIAAALKLLSPPAPFSLPALAKAMQAEKDHEVLKAITEALARLDVGPRLKTDFAWAPGDEDAARRYAVLSLARRLPAKHACEFLGDCLKANPPNDHRMRAAFASAFRKLRPKSLDELRDTLVKSKDKAVQLEAVRLLGMMRDRAALPSLKLALGGSRELMTASFNAIEKTGGVAIPLVMEMLGEGNDEVRRFARILAQRITRESIDGVSELQKWYAQYRRHIDDDEKEFWKDQEEKDFPVGPDEFRIFDRKLPSPKDP
jgi:hypothetical protein